MAIDQGCLDILRYISESSEAVSLTSLAQYYQLSERGIRYRLDRIDAFLSSINLPHLQRHYASGITYTPTPVEREQLSKYFSTHIPKRYRYSTAERETFIATELLEADEPLNADYFIQVLQISRGTLSKDCKSIEALLANFGLEIVRKQRVGMYVEGEERQKRAALSHLNTGVASVHELFEYLATGKATQRESNLHFENFFADLDIDYIDTIIRHAETSLHASFSDMAYSSLLTHIAIMIKRIQLGNNVLMVDTHLDDVEYSRELAVAKEMLASIEAHYEITAPKEEVTYLVLHLLGVTHIESSLAPTIVDDQGLTGTINAMIAAVEAIYDLEFSQEIYRNLLQGLLLHLRPAINRVKFNLPITNPIYNEIVSEYSELLVHTRLVTQLLEHYIGLPINDHEISYLMLHFGAAIKMARQSDRPVRALLVCGSGIGTANMLKSQLMKQYVVDIVGTTSARNISSYSRLDFDIIISTIKIPALTVHEYVLVNVILGPADYAQLDTVLLMRRSQIASNRTNLDSIMAIIGKHAVIRSPEQLRGELHLALAQEMYLPGVVDRVLAGDGLALTDQDKGATSALALCVGDKIQLVDRIADGIADRTVEPPWQQAVHRCCQPLIDAGSVSPAYVDRIVEQTLQLGAFMNLGNGLVLLHCDAPDEVHATDFALLRIQEGMEFITQESALAYVYIAFSSHDGVAHRKALETLVHKASQEKWIMNVRNAQSADDVIALLS